MFTSSMFGSLSLLVLCTSPVVSAASISGCKTACASISKALGPQALIDEPFYWANQQKELTPACYVLPTSSQEVSTVIKTATKNKCQFAIRGGGHSDVPGASNSDGGITLDLGSFKDIKTTTDSSGKTITRIGAGQNWGNVYQTLDQSNLTVVGGRESTVGVAGLTLGGGISYFSGMHGFACDNVANYEVVLANGDIVQANRSSNYADLHRALRGGGNNFGAVTYFDLNTYEQGLMHGGLVEVSDAEGVQESIIDAFTEFSNNAPSDHKAASFISLSSVAGSHNWIFSLTYTKPYSKIPAIFRPFYTKTIKKNTQLTTQRNATHGNLAQELGSTQPSGFREQFHTATFKVNSKLQNEIFNIFREETATLFSSGTVKNSTGLTPACALQPFTKPFLKAQTANGYGPNVLGLKPSEAPLMVLSMAWPWVDPADDEAVSGGMARVVQRSVAKAKRMGLFHGFVYMNYASQTGEEPLTSDSYGTDNISFLKKVSKDVDPKGVFQTLVPGGFKLNED